MSTCEICGRMDCEVAMNAKPWPALAEVIEHWRLGYEREKEQAQVSEEGFATARLTIAEMVAEKIALEARADAAEAEREVNAQLHASVELDLVEAREALAAARRALADYKEHHPCSALEHKHAAALAAPADGEEGKREPFPGPRCTCHARKSGKHAQSCELWNTTGPT